MTSIQNFEVYPTNILDTKIQIKLEERVEFQYTSGIKPTGLTSLIPDEKGLLHKRHQSIFEYDAKGNLVREHMHIYPRDKALGADYFYEYFYDANPNSRRLLHTIFFKRMGSAPMVFSSNNVNREKITYEGITLRDHTFKMTYDLNGNITTDYNPYWDMKWICE